MKWPPPLGNQYYRNLLPDVPIANCPTCNKVSLSIFKELEFSSSLFRYSTKMTLNCILYKGATAPFAEHLPQMLSTKKMSQRISFNSFVSNDHAFCVIKNLYYMPYQ
jgi:hypothetical protein